MYRVTQKKGVIVIQDIYVKVIKREKTEVKKTRKALE